MLLERCGSRSAGPTSMVAPIVESVFVGSVLLLLAVDGRLRWSERKSELLLQCLICWAN